MKKESSTRLTVLFTKHHKWLLQVAYNISRSAELSEDLVQDLYVYLGQKENKKLFYKDSYNLMYCMSFIKSRFINRIKIMNRHQSILPNFDIVDEEYDTEFDNRMEQCYNDIQYLLKDLQATKLWAPAKITELYFYNDTTLDKLSKEIKISKSTTFLAVKKIREYLKSNVTNPFKDAKEL